MSGMSYATIGALLGFVLCVLLCVLAWYVLRREESNLSDSAVALLKKHKAADVEAARKAVEASKTKAAESIEAAVRENLDHALSDASDPVDTLNNP